MREPYCLLIYNNTQIALRCAQLASIRPSVRPSRETTVSYNMLLSWTWFANTSSFLLSVLPEEFREKGYQYTLVAAHLHKLPETDVVRHH